MSHLTTSAKALRTISARLEAAMDACRPFGDAEDPRDIKLALASLLLSCHVALDSLADVGGKATLSDMAAAAGLPPISGGAPVESVQFESYLADQAAGDEWPEGFHPEYDAVFWNAAPDHDGPTPAEVLAADPDAPAWKPSAADLAEMAEWSDGLWTEADQVLHHGCV